MSLRRVVISNHSGESVGVADQRCRAVSDRILDLLNVSRITPTEGIECGALRCCNAQILH